MKHDTQCCACRKPMTVEIEDGFDPELTKTLLRVATCDSCMKPAERKRIWMGKPERTYRQPHND